MKLISKQIILFAAFSSHMNAYKNACMYLGLFLFYRVFSWNVFMKSILTNMNDDVKIL